MKRDECVGALHEIAMREAPQRSKCYILISTVTLCYSLRSSEGHIAELAEHMALHGDTDKPSAGMRAQAGEWARAGSMPPRQPGKRTGTEEEGERVEVLSYIVSVSGGNVLAVSPVC